MRVVRAINLQFRVGLSRESKRAGWTLIELIAVLAVSALLAAVMIPALLHELDRTARAWEASRLRELSLTLRRVIQRTGSVPNPAGLGPAVTPMLAWRTQDAATNERALSRAFLVDPRCRIGPSTNQSLPFFQTASGSDLPVGARFVMLSSLGEPLPSAVVTGATLTSEAFEAIWQAPPETIPAGWTWTGRANDLLVERLDIADLFIPVTLNNPTMMAPRFGVATNSLGTLGAGGFTTRYLRGTALYLADEAGRLQMVEIVETASSWVYASGKWQRTGAWNQSPEMPSGRDFEELANRFRQAPVNPSGPADAAARVLMAMTNFSASYEAWGAAGFNGPLGTNSAPVQAWQALRQATAGLLAAP